MPCRRSDSRGHRLCILDPAYAVLGVQVGEHKTFGWCAVIEFAGGFEDDEALVNARREAGPPQVATVAPAVHTQWQLGQACPLRLETTCLVLVM